MPSLARNVARLQCWLTNLPRFQGARPDHVRVEKQRQNTADPLGVWAK